MKKHLIAAAVAAAVAVPAFAQNVSIYGVLDVGYSKQEAQAVDSAHNRKTTETGAEGNMAGNRLGFRGTEDLGGGLKAGFVYEISILPTETDPLQSSTGAIANRQAFVSLGGNFGEVAIGRFNTLTKVIQDSNTFGGPGFGIGWTTAMVAATNSPTGVLNQVTGADAATLFPSLNAERISNTIQYKSPTFSGFSASVQLADNSDDITAATAGKRVTGDGTIVGLNYASGPLALAVAQKSIKSNAAEAATTQKDEHTAFLATYDFGTAKVFFVMNEASNQAAGDTLKTKFEDYSIGVRVPLGNLALLAQYSDGEYKTAAATPVQTDLSGYQLGAQYALSKRTTAYAYYGEDEAKRTGATKGERSGFALGVRHSF